MKAVLFICIWVITIPAIACTCGIANIFKTKDDLHGYDFIALVNVKSLPPADSAKNAFHLRRFGDIGIDIIELFKGDPINVVYDENFENDCAMPVAQNVQWILFGYKRDDKV